MKRIWNFARVCTMVFVCALFLGLGMKAEAAAPGTVSGLKQTNAGSSYVEIAWNAVIGNDIQYKVELCADKNFSGGVKDNLYYNSEGKITGATDDPDEYFSGLTSGKKYYVRVTSFTNTGYPDYTCSWGTPSSVLEVVTCPAGSNVTDFKQTKATETSITLSWKKYPGANAYRLEYQKEGSSSKKTVYLKDVSTYTVKSLSKNTEYEFSLYPINKSASGYQAVGSSRGWIYSIPVLPTKVTGVGCGFWSPTSNYMDITWNIRNSADGYQYQIYTETGKKALLSGKKTGNGKSTYFSSEKLKGYRFLKLRVRAYIDVKGDSKYGIWSDWVYFSRQPGIKLKNSSSGIKVSWDKVSGAKDYTIYVSDKKESGYKKVGTTKKTSTTVKKYGKSNLKSGRQYYFFVTANKKVGKKTFHSTDNYCWYTTYRK